jgi:hypothetical protein
MELCIVGLSMWEVGEEVGVIKFVTGVVSIAKRLCGAIVEKIHC